MNFSSQPGILSPKRTILLAWLLRLCGLIDSLALLFALIPASWLVAAHQKLNVGEFPQDTITHYLARSTSLMYAAHGFLLIYLSFDVSRYIRLIRFLACLALAHGCLLISLDLQTGMPWWWTLTEGPLLIAWGTVVLCILMRASARIDASVRA